MADSLTWATCADNSYKWNGLSVGRTLYGVHLNVRRAFSVARVVASLALRCFRAISIALLDVSDTTFDFSMTSAATSFDCFAVSTAVEPCRVVGWFRRTAAHRDVHSEKEGKEGCGFE